MVGAVLGHAERLSGRDDSSYMKLMSALFAIGAGIAAYSARPVAMITFSVTSIGFAALVVALRWANERDLVGVSSSQEPEDARRRKVRRPVRPDME